MGEIVIDYARADEGRAAQVIKKLESLGFNVRRLDARGPGSARRRTPSAAALRVALVSRHYPAARARGAALAARLDGAPVPAIMRSALVDLRAWRGRDDHRGWRQLTAKLSAAAAPRASQAPRVGAKDGAPPAAPSPAKGVKKGALGPALAWLAGAAAVLAGAAGVWVSMH